MEIQLKKYCIEINMANPCHIGPMSEMLCFHSDLTVKMYLKFEVLHNFHYIYFFGAPPPCTQTYFLLGSEQILKMTAEFRGTLTCLGKMTYSAK